MKMNIQKTDRHYNRARILKAFKLAIKKMKHLTSLPFFPFSAKNDRCCSTLAKFLGLKKINHTHTHKIIIIIACVITYLDPWSSHTVLRFSLYD